MQLAATSHCSLASLSVHMLSCTSTACHRQHGSMSRRTSLQHDLLLDALTL